MRLDGVNLGSGGDYRERWVNVDVDPSCDPDVVLDLEDETWPFEDGRFSVALVYNVFEHINPKRRVNFLSETHRVLVSDGRLLMRLPTPAYGIGWDVTHYSVPSWRWPYHPRHSGDWSVENVTTTPFGPGLLLPDAARIQLMRLGLVVSRGVEIEVRKEGGSR